MQVARRSRLVRIVCATLFCVTSFGIALFCVALFRVVCRLWTHYAQATLCVSCVDAGGGG